MANKDIFWNKPTIERPHQAGDGIHKIWKFDNGYGASVVQFKLPFGGWGSYTDNENEWELAVIKITGDGEDDWELTYETPITDDVIGHLTKEEVLIIMGKIQELKYAIVSGDEQ